jgi:D-galacturonate reductase
LVKKNEFKFMNIIVIGTGMYSTGRGTEGYGTVLPAVNEWFRNKKHKSKVLFVGTNGMHSNEAKLKAEKLSEDSNVELDVSFLPANGVVDRHAYLSAIKEVPRPACAIIVVPDHLHYQVTHDCLMEDLPVLVAKPLTPTVEEGRKLVKLAEERSLYAAVEFHKRWDKANLMIRDRVQKGDLGELLYCWVEYSQRKSIPTKIFKDWADKTTILQYLGIHYIDLVRFYTCAIPVRVMAVGQKKWLSKRGIDTFDAMQCTIEWETENGNRFIQTILTNWIDPESSTAMSDQKIKIVGTNGRFESDQKERGIRINLDDGQLEQPNPDYCMEYSVDGNVKEWRGYGIDSITTFLNDIEDINNNRADIESLSLIRPTFSEAVISTAVVEAAHKSLLNNNKWQNV